MSATRPSHRSRHSERGFTLIEVMIALLIFSVGLLGTAALQARAVQIATQNGDRSRAALLVNEMVAKLWANQSVDVSVTPLSSDYSAWMTSVSTASVSGLPSGTGSVVACTGGTANCAVVKVTWQAPSSATAAPLNSYTTTVVIQ